MRAVKQYQRVKSTPASATWFVLPSNYDNDKDNQFRSDGDDYSFVNYAGDQKLGIASMSSKINFFQDGLIFKIPVYLIQDEEDIQTPVSICWSYYYKIKAPSKKLILLPNTEHGFNQAVIDAHYKVMREYIMPGIK